jgi:hypothetical protein
MGYAKKNGLLPNTDTPLSETERNQTHAYYTPLVQGWLPLLRRLDVEEP